MIRAVIRLVLPAHLRTLSCTGVELALAIDGPVTLQSVIDCLEKAHPALAGTLRDRATGQRRPFVRFFACGEDWSHQSLQQPLPALVAQGTEPLLIVGAIAGGVWSGHHAN